MNSNRKYTSTLNSCPRVLLLVTAAATATDYGDGEAWRARIAAGLAAIEDADMRLTIDVLVAAEDCATPEAVRSHLLHPLFTHEYGVLLTAGDGPDWRSVPANIVDELTSNMGQRWIHRDVRDVWAAFGDGGEDSRDRLIQQLYNAFLYFVEQRARPRVSVFTTAFESFAKIERVYASLQRQLLTNWEWVILDDSRDDRNFCECLRPLSLRDARIRAYRRDFHAGNIGMAKSEAAALCRSDVLVEVDHDDELLPDCLLEIRTAFDAFPQAGFVYMTFAECEEETYVPLTYTIPYAMGFGYYRTERAAHDGRAYEVANTPNLSAEALRCIVGAPNHPRAWRRSILLSEPDAGGLGNFSEMLPVADDYELLLRTALTTPAVRINKFGYVQFRARARGENFTFARNAEITRLSRRLADWYATRLQRVCPAPFDDEEGTCCFPSAEAIADLSPTALERRENARPHLNVTLRSAVQQCPVLVQQALGLDAAPDLRDIVGLLREKGGKDVDMLDVYAHSKFAPPGYVPWASWHP